MSYPKSMIETHKMLMNYLDMATVYGLEPDAKDTDIKLVDIMQPMAIWSRYVQDPQRDEYGAWLTNKLAEIRHSEKVELRDFPGIDAHTIIQIANIFGPVLTRASENVKSFEERNANAPTVPQFPKLKEFLRSLSRLSR